MALAQQVADILCPNHSVIKGQSFLQATHYKGEYSVFLKRELV